MPIRTTLSHTLILESLYFDRRWNFRAWQFVYA